MRTSEAFPAAAARGILLNVVAVLPALAAALVTSASWGVHLDGACAAYLCECAALRH